MTSTSVYIKDADGNVLYIYKLGTEVALGDVITVTGKVGEHYGAKQLVEATAEITGHDDTVTIDYTEMTITEALAAADGTFVKVTGTVSEIVGAWSETYKNMNVNIVDAEGNILYAYRLYANVKVGDYITITGKMTTHDENRQIGEGCTAVIGVNPETCEHVYDNCDDTLCDTCGTTRDAVAHVYDGCEDTTCANCDATREAGTHVFDNDCQDTVCNNCPATREAAAHVYDDCADTTCNNCAFTREAGTHVFTYCDSTKCEYCDEINENATTHVFDNDCTDTTCNNCPATREAAAAHVYDNCDDTTCNNNNCAVTRDAVAHVYDGCEDTTCANCDVTREAGTHAFDNNCADTTCNNEGCNGTREAIPHTGADEDFVCDACGAKVYPAADSVLTLKQADVLGGLYAHNTTSTDKYYVTGVIIDTPNATYGNLHIRDVNGNEFYIYGLYDESSNRYDAMPNKPVKGDTITVYGIIGNYNGPQMKNGTVTEHTNGHTCEYTDPTCEAVAKCKLCGATTGELADHVYVEGVCSVCGHVEGAQEVVKTTVTMSYSGATSNMTGENDATTLGLDAAIFSVIGNKGSTNNNCGLNKAGQIRLYGYSSNGNGSYFTVTIADGYVIDSIKITFSNTTNNKNCQLSVDGDTLTTTEASYSSNVLESDINSDNFKLQNVIQGATTQIYISSIEITYHAE